MKYVHVYNFFLRVDLGFNFLLSNFILFHICGSIYLCDRACSLTCIQCFSKCLLMVEVGAELEAEFMSLTRVTGTQLLTLLRLPHKVLISRILESRPETGTEAGHSNLGFGHPN